MLHLRGDGSRGPKELRKGPDFSAKDQIARAAVQSLMSQKESGSEAATSLTPPVMVARIGKQLNTSFQVHEQPTDDSISVSSISASTVSPFSSVSKGNSNSDTKVLVSKALLSRIEYLEPDK